MLPRDSAWCGLQTKAIWPWELMWLMFSSPQPSLSRASRPLRILCHTAVLECSNSSVLHSLLSRCHHSLGSAGAWALNGPAELGSVLHLLSLLFSNFPWSSSLGLGIAVLQHHILKPQLGGMGKGLMVVKEGLGPPDWSPYCLSPWGESGKMVHFPSCSLAFPAGTTLITAMMWVVWKKQR